MGESNLEDLLNSGNFSQSEVGFKPEQMIACPKCCRNNPPNRLNCFYCAAELELSESLLQSIKPNLRKAENWEKAFNIINLPSSNHISNSEKSYLKDLLKLEAEVLDSILTKNNPLPLARVSTEKEALIVQNQLAEVGIKTSILSDETLAVEKPPVRLRGIDFIENRLILILFNGDEIVEMQPEDLVLIVWGINLERQLIATEKYSKKGSNKILESSEVASDEHLFDIFNRQNNSGYRIYSRGFDFSVLENEKQLLARDNIKKLVAKLREFAPEAKFVDSYMADRAAISAVWEIEEKNASKNFKRSGLGKFNLENVTTSSNLAQFTKYSRLQWHLL